MSIIAGILFGFILWFLFRYLLAGLFTVDQNERAVKTAFGRAERIGRQTTLDDPISEMLDDEERTRYCYPQLRVIPPGGPYFKWPWERVYKTSIAVNTVSMAYDPEVPAANEGGTRLEAVTKDQLDTGLTGQIRYRISERNLYAWFFGVKNPVAHVMGYFISILRERIANFEAPVGTTNEPGDIAAAVAGISINDLRKNLSSLNESARMRRRVTASHWMPRSSQASIPRRMSNPLLQRSIPRTIKFRATSALLRPTRTRRSSSPDERSRSRRSTRRPRSSPSPRLPGRLPR